MKKSVICILAFVLIIGLLISNLSYISVKAEDEYSVEVGKKIKLKTGLKNPVWGSTDTSIATVTKKGYVKGKKSGTCIISAVSKGKSEVFSVKVKAKSAGSKAVKIEEHEGYENFSTYYNGSTDRISQGVCTWLKSPLNTYIDGKEIKERASISEVVESIKKTRYFLSDKRELKGISDISYKYYAFDESRLDDIIGEGYLLYVVENNTLIAEILFELPKDKLYFKDLIVKDVKLYKEAYENPDTYYFNNSFHPLNIPTFEEFENNSLIEGNITWTRKIYGSTTEFHSQTIYLNLYNDYTISEGIIFNIIFDNHTHKCTEVQVGW